MLHFYVFIGQQHPFQTHGTTHLIPHTPAQEIAVLIPRVVEAPVTIQHVQVQRQKPEQHQVRAKI